MELKKCPCCGQKTLPLNSFFDICHVCGWEDDKSQSDDPDNSGGANKLSLNQARKAWEDRTRTIKKGA
jgi:hypothetical protein